MGAKERGRQEEEKGEGGHCGNGHVRCAHQAGPNAKSGPVEEVTFSLKGKD